MTKKRKEGNAYLIPPRGTRKTVARILVQLTDEAVDDQKKLQQLYVLADRLRYFLNTDQEDIHNGLGTEIACWIGLLITTHEMGLEYRKNLIEIFPEELDIFADSK